MVKNFPHSMRQSKNRQLRLTLITGKNTIKIMKQIILIQSQSDIDKIIGLNINTYIGIEPISRKNALDCIELLSILPTIDLIITPERLGTEQTAQEIIDYIKANNLKVELIILGTSRPQDLGKAVEDPKNWQEIIQQIGILLDMEINLGQKQIINYLPIPIGYFFKIETCCSDVFVRIKKGPKDYQYMKRITINEPIDHSLLEQYRKKGIRYLHIEREKRVELVNHISNQLVKKLENAQDPKASSEEKIGIISNSYDVATSEIADIGIAPASVQLTESIIETLRHYNQQREKLTVFLRKLLNTSASPLYWTCHICSAISVEILSRMKVDREVSNKFAYASFFHDIFLVENPNLSRINSAEDLNAANLEKKEYDLVLNHAALAANLIIDYEDAPLGTDTLIRHHHGNIKGVGFARDVKALPRWSRLFCLICQFSDAFNKIKSSDQQTGQGSIFSILQEKNPEPEMKEPLDLLKDFLPKK